MSRVGWLDLSCGASGDMLLGALVGAGAPLHTLSGAVDALGLGLALRASEVRRGGLKAIKVEVRHPARLAEDRRTWRNVRALLETSKVAEPVRSRSFAVFAALAGAEAAVHGVEPEEVHFHEVGALDTLADVVGVSAGLVALDLDRLVASPIAVGAGTVRGAHGVLPVPGPAVLELLRRARAPAHGGGVDVELCTPTGAALVTTSVTEYGPLPALTVDAVGIGAGTHELLDRPNVVRLVIGAQPDEGDTIPPVAQVELLLESNVDDLDPRAWPAVLDALLAAGAADAWLTPVLMKKGRPAHTLAALVPPETADAVRAAVFAHTTTLGLRETRVAKRTLDRDYLIVEVDGEQVTVKTACLPDGTVVNAQPEWADVTRVAATLGRPAKLILAQAIAAAVRLYGRAPTQEGRTRAAGRA